MALIDDFKARFPEFATATVDTYLPILENVWPAYYGLAYTSQTQEAILNLIAHLLVGETSVGSAASQQVASVSVGSVSESYQAAANLKASDVFWNSTKYGQRFRRLTAGRYGGIAV